MILNQSILSLDETVSVTPIRVWVHMGVIVIEGILHTLYIYSTKASPSGTV